MGERKNLGSDFNNRKNGYNSKTVKTKDYAFVLDTPRDRKSSFEPQIVRKNQTVLTEELDNKIIALYGFGMGYRYIIPIIILNDEIEFFRSQLCAPIHIGLRSLAFKFKA